MKAEGAFWRGKYCSLNAARRAIEDSSDMVWPARVGYITSKKLGAAVKRNRARRLMRESVRQLADRVQPNWDIVLVARSDMVGIGVRRQDVQEELQWLLKKARIAM